ncbi:hypothetical protein SAY86_031350 [Trapa natans]|uniref:MYB transcription factor n=1 Tax=Trapa natans TaxID=22666 RepID=A0AAN7R5T6_TRANT|nr:hypothetical protein SAY86_031350 [Trapa natans]
MMGNRKQKWTAEEEAALLAGVAKLGPGKWKNILRDPEFVPSLVNRSNIDLKDKWRNLNVSGPSSKDKLQLPKVKDLCSAHKTVTHSSGAPSVLDDNSTADAGMNDTSNRLHDSKDSSTYDELIFEVLSAVTDRNGADIVQFSATNRSEKRQEVPPNFQSHVGSRLRRLVLQGKLEKVHNTYRINRDAPLRKRPAAPKQMDIQLRLIQSPMLSSHETLQEAAMAAAYKIAEAENKSFLASEAVKEAERVSKMADDSDAMLQLMKEIYGQCSRGERIIPA